MSLENKIKRAEIDPKTVTREIEDFIIDQVTNAGADGAVLGISGGIDSAAVAYLTQSAFERYNQEAETDLKLYGMILPAGKLHDEDTKDAIKIAEDLGIEYKVVDIEPILEVRKQVNPEIFEKDYHLGNSASRERMVQLYGEANERKSLVLGTGNRDEDYCIGYFTKFGDGGVDISPIGELSKRNVRIVAEYIGIPDTTVNREPTARLWAGQTDSEELGFDYDPHVETVMNGFDQGYSRDEIHNITGFNYKIIDGVKGMHDRNQHKMDMPPVAEITMDYR